MKYKSVVATRRGGPQVFQVIEQDLPALSSGYARVRILAAPVCLPDVQSRYGLSPFAPKTPFVPGYAVVGVVDAIGDMETSSEKASVGIAVGDRVASLTVFNGYAESITLPLNQLLPVPAGLDSAEVATLMLNYLVAYQTLHRSARVKAGDTILIVGASGGIGTAYLQLGRLAGLKMYAIASRSKHAILQEYGAIPIDYHTQDFVEVIRQAQPEGIDFVFDGMGGGYFKRSLAVLRRGGRYVGYGNPLSIRNTLRLIGGVILCNLLPNGKSAALYGTGASRFKRRPFLEDWAALFSLLAAGKIRPVIARKFALLEAAQANTLLESGQVTGNVVLMSPELLRA